MADTTNGRGGSGVVIVGEEDGEGLNIYRRGYVSNRFVIVSIRSVTTLTATTTIHFLKSRSAIRTVDFTMSTAPQFFTNSHDITMINPIISNYQYQYLGGE